MYFTFVLKAEKHQSSKQNHSLHLFDEKPGTALLLPMLAWSVGIIYSSMCVQGGGELRMLAMKRGGEVGEGSLVR